MQNLETLKYLLRDCIICVLLYCDKNQIDQLEYRGRGLTALLGKGAWLPP